MLIKLYRIFRSIFNGTGISRVYPLNKLHAWFLKRYKAEKIFVNNYTMYLDEIDTLGLTVKGDYDVFQLRIIDQLVKKGDTVLDIGANIGYYTLHFANVVGDKGKVYAFEPDHTNFKLLTKNIEVNKFSNIDAYDKAVTQNDTTLKLFLNKENRGDNRIYSTNTNWESINIQGVKLDGFINTTNVAFVKIDIQGSEFGAFKGMEKIIDKSKNITILTEFWPEGIVNFGDKPLDILNFFLNKGFSIYEVDQKKNKILTLSPEEILLKYPVEKGLHTDLLISNNAEIRKTLSF